MAGKARPDGEGVPQRRGLVAECAGACGDLGTFVPHVVGAMTVAGRAPAGVLVGFGISFVAAGLFYGLPMAVQPMKAVSAVLLTGQLTPEATAAAGLIIGTVLLALGATGLIGRVARLIPQSVTSAICRDLYPDRADRATVRNLALTSGAANLLLAPFDAAGAIGLSAWLAMNGPDTVAAVLGGTTVVGVTTALVLGRSP